MSLKRAGKSPRSVFLFFVLAFVVFTCVFPYNASLNNPNENVRVYMTMALVEHHTFRIDAIVERHGWVNDMAKAPDPKTNEPHFYSIKGPATGYFGVPFYWAFTKIAPRFGHPVPTLQSTPEAKAWWFRATTFVVRFFVVQIPCFLFLVFFERWLRATIKDVPLRLCCVAAAGLGTNYIAYSLMFVSHSLFAIAAFTSFAIITSERLRFPLEAERRRLSRAFLAGLFAGLASLLEYHAFPISVGLALYALTAFWRPSRYVVFGLGALIDAAALMFYQWRCYNNPLTPGHKLAENQYFATWHKQGFFGLGIPNWGVFRDLSLSHTFGFFGTSPFMWLGLLVIPFGIILSYGAPLERKIRRDANIAWLLLMFVLWFSICCAVNWRGGWTVGPRFFGAAPMFFAFGAATALEWFSRRGRVLQTIARGVAGGLLLASVVQMGFVSLVFNTIPEDIQRPLPEFAIPLARAGFVPHHAGEIFGWMSPWGWYIVLGCMGLAALIAALVYAREAWFLYAARVVLVFGVFALALRPAFSKPSAEEAAHGNGSGTRRGFARSWEPAGRDRLSSLRTRAETNECLWKDVVKIERTLDLDEEATRHETRARAGCP